VHDQDDDRNFGALLYRSYKQIWSQSEYVSCYPAHHKFAYVYAVREDNNLIWARKTGLQTWELPGGTIEKGEVADEAAVREFLRRRV
jgi:hypothetical protein